MKKKLLVLLSLFSAMTVSLFGAVGCSKKEGNSVGESSIESSIGGEQSSEAPSQSTDSSVEDTTPSISLSSATLSMEVYASATLTAELKNSEETIVWSSSDEAIVKVVDGVVTAYKAGTATVTATAGALSASCEVTVAEATEAPVFANLEETLTLIKGTSDFLDVTLTYKGEAFTMATVNVATEGDKIAIGEEYEVSANEYGSQTITVTATIGAEVVATATVAVEVIEFGTLIVDLPENKLNIFVGDEGYALSSIQAMVNGVVVENPVFTVVSTDEEVVKEVDGKIVPVSAGEAEVTVSFATEMATYDTKLAVTVAKHVEKKDVNFLVKGSNEITVAETGNATVDLSATEIDLTKVTNVLCGEEEVAFTVDGSNLTLTNAPGGYQLYTLVTPTLDYIVDGCVYGYAISTAEEFIEWRENVYHNVAYTVLLNDIDLKGEKLSAVQAPCQLRGTLDGRGYTVSNFTFGYNYGMFYYINNGATLKNIQIVNAVQDCTGQAAGAAINKGIFGDNLMGSIENVLVKISVKNMQEGTEHYGLLVYFCSLTASIKNAVVYAEAQDCAPKYFYGAAASGEDGCNIENVQFVCANTGMGISGKPSVNSGCYSSTKDLTEAVDVESFGGLWQVIDGIPCMSDYTENESEPSITVTGIPILGATLTFDTTAFYPLTYAVSETAGITLSGNNQVVIGADAEIGAEFTVTATCAAMPAFSKTFTYTVEKEAIEVAGVMLAKGSSGKWEYNTGVATFDFADKGVDLTDIEGVLIDGVAFNGYTVEGNTITLTDAPGGDHIYTIETAAHTYVVKACVYTLAISTVEELEAWRTSESYWYAVLLNDIDYEGATLNDGANVLGTLGGRGYTIKNFTTANGFINRLYAAESAIKNVYFKNVTQDCSGWTGGIDR
ncbi:MAG: Ig-like domain-containing protein, partial [Clostridia bacterium]|nr:Ig-like domain-containing protein [Clostridia bacterium]